MAAIKKMFDDKTIHVELKHEESTREQARDYCKKDGDWQEYGTWIKGQGARSDIDAALLGIVHGEVKVSDFKEEDPWLYCRYKNGIEALGAHAVKKKSKKWRNVEVILITGPTGSGKTSMAAKEAQYRIQGTQLAWWQDYDGEECILIDEYSNDVKITEMLSLLDGYQLRLNVKGSHTYANWNKVYITTNLKVEQLHSEAREAHRDALFRRITSIINLWNEVV